uniref:Uncharacterized protein n=1 Tax=Plectus sambesii TaxID=2011161 RepID=A0A914WWV4_9BILA
MREDNALDTPGERNEGIGVPSTRQGAASRAKTEKGSFVGPESRSNRHSHLGRVGRQNSCARPPIITSVESSSSSVANVGTDVVKGLSSFVIGLPAYC